MLTKLILNNFKCLPHAEIELGNRVVFIGPNNSGKTSALQAISLWNLGVKQWLEKRSGKNTPERRPGVLIGRREIAAIPIPSLDQLWNDKKLRRVTKIEKTPHTQNIVLQIAIEGISGEKGWTCGLEFDYRDEESIYVRPLKVNGSRSSIPPEAGAYSVVMLPPMSGLAANETRLDIGAIDTRIGEGRTAEVLRNLCYLVYTTNGGGAPWNRLVEKISKLFGVMLEPPNYLSQRGEIEMAYRDRRNTQLDISAAGRGLQQTLMLLAYMEVHPKSVLLLDEPDAHLEIVRQREIYSMLSDYANEHNSQLIAASHSEVVLDEAAQKDIVVAFVGRPHRIDDRGKELRKALVEIGFSDYYQAEEKCFVVYLEGSTDLSILQTISGRVNHKAAKVLEQPFVKDVANNTREAARHFYGLREAVPGLRGYALF